MPTIDTGSAVTCGICGKDTTVSSVTEPQGTPAYNLGCFHRNAVCATCGKLVRDNSETIHEVHPACRDCNPELFVDDDDE